MSNVIRVIAGVRPELGQVLEHYMAGQQDMELIGCVDDGFQLVERIGPTLPDVVVVEMILPGLDGLAVLERIQAEHSTRRPRVLVLAPPVPDVLVQQILRAGADYILVKPLRMEILGDRVRQLTRRSSTTEVESVAGSVWGSVALQPTRPAQTLDVTIAQMLSGLGVPSQIKGFRYLRRAIGLVVGDLRLVNSMTKELYPGIAREFQTTPAGVERSIRHAICVAWSRGDSPRLQELFSYTTGRPCNSEFIAQLASRLEKGE